MTTILSQRKTGPWKLGDEKKEVKRSIPLENNNPTFIIAFF